MHTLRSLIHQNFPPSCISAADVHNVTSVLSDTDFLFPNFATPSPVQERLASYYTVAGVLLGLPSPVAKRKDHTIRFAEDIRLPTKIRESRELFERCVATTGVSIRKREDLLLDVFPYWRVIDGNLSSKIKAALHELCDYPVRGRLKSKRKVVLEPEQGEEMYTGGWLPEDDIED
jgi:hypothetical protein